MEKLQANVNPRIGVNCVLIVLGSETKIQSKQMESLQTVKYANTMIVNEKYLIAQEKTETQITAANSGENYSTYFWSKDTLVKYNLNQIHVLLQKSKHVNLCHV